jgi:hypothetical protein
MDMIFKRDFGNINLVLKSKSNMSQIFLISIFAVVSSIAIGQNVGIGTNTPNAAAMLHVNIGSSPSHGFLVTGTENGTPTVPNLGAGSRLMFYPGKAAFRAGRVDDTKWDDWNVGRYSVAMGWGAEASGLSSVALGGGTKAFGEYATALGLFSSAIGRASLAVGNSANAIGKESIAIGLGTTAKAMGSVSLGMYNDDFDNLSNLPQQSDRIFQIGNGEHDFGRKNALTMLRSGFTGFGVIDPAYRLDIAGRMRIRSGGTGSTSAGIWLNKNDNSGLLGFVGVDGSNDIGIFNQTSGWSFLVRDATGNAWVKGTVTANGVTLTSDERLKKDITRLGNAMPLLEKLNGYQYHWKDATADAGLQSGLLAQEVEQVMPELVMTDEKGMKSVNYMGIIPYLLEAAKEQQALNRMQQQQIGELKMLVEQLSKK